MKKTQFLNHVAGLTRYFLVFLFTYTAINKIIDHATFETTILQSPLLRNYGKILSWLIPFTELIIVALLLSKKYLQPAMLLSLALMTFFTGYIAYMMLFIPNLPCSCGGILKELSWPGHLFFNSGVIVLIMISLFSKTRNKFLLQ